MLSGMPGGPNYIIVEHAPLDARRGVYPANPGPTDKPTDPRGTGGPSPASTGGPNYLLGAGAAYALGPEPKVYVSKRKGPVAVERMSPVWARRAAKAVQEGRRPGEPRGILKVLRRRARQG